MKMNIFLCAAGSLAVAPFVKTVAGEKPNIILFLADDISRDDLGCYGHPLVKTPNIDALAEEGMRFTNVFLTISSSSPSRSSIMTGRYPHNTGACELHAPIGDEQVFFSCLLQEAGYYTAQAGKWHIGGASVEPNGPALKCFDRAGGSRKDGGGASGCRMWTTYLRERPKDRPFFMWFSSHDAHRNYGDGEAVPESYRPEDVVPSAFHVNDAATRKDLAGYYSEISRFDYYTGEVVKELKAQKVFDNTVIVIMADNGRGFPRAKTLLYESGIATPFIVCYPGKVRQKGAVCSSLVSAIDLAPTLLEWAGAGMSPTFQGRSFAGLLENPQAGFRNYVFAEHNWHVNEAYERMVATERYLLIENRRPGLPVKANMDTPAGKSLNRARKAGTLTAVQAQMFRMPRRTTELYDRISDPDQTNDLAARHPGLVRDLLKILHQWQDETGDTVPEHLKPDRSKGKTNFDDLIEMPGASSHATLINRPGPF
jgi:arylsulfatase A-like enzyme